MKVEIKDGKAIIQVDRRTVVTKDAEAFFKENQDYKERLSPKKQVKKPVKKTKKKTKKK